MTNRRLLLTALRLLGAAAAMIVLLLWMAGSFERKIPPGHAQVGERVAPADAIVKTVEEESVPVIEEAAGTLQAARKTVVSSRIVAAIQDIRVNAGDRVAAGDVLVVLDDRSLVARVQEAERALEAAQATRKQAESEYQRAQQLLQTGVVSRSEFDQAESAFRVAVADSERAAEALQRARVELSYTEITAPVSGRVIDRLADPGDTALPGQPLLSLYDPTALRIEVPVREQLVGSLRVGQRLNVRLGSEASTIEGTVDEIVPQAEAGSRTFLVKVGLPKYDHLYTGMFGRVLLPAGEHRRTLVPAAAVERVGQLAFVDVVDEQKRLSRRLVTLGSEVDDEGIEVLSGLRPGETVLIGAQSHP